MRKLMVLGLALPLCFGVIQAADSNDSQNSNIIVSNDASSDNCSEHLRNGDNDQRSTLRDEEMKTISNQALTITAEHNGGIQVTTWEKPEISLKLCKQISTTDEAEGRKLLAETRLEINGSQITVLAPEGGHYSPGTVLLVKAPKDANLNLNVHNGGISLSGFTGMAQAHAQNGGISFRQSTGKLTAEAENGGVSIKDCGGDVTASVRNGGVSIALPERWEGKGLEAHSTNGGLLLSLPKSFNGGLEVMASEQTSIICRDDVCNAGERSSEGGHKVFRMGGVNPQIRASSENGGIVIEERGRARKAM
jgi:hypothetical protein